MNLLPLIVYQASGLGELKKTKIDHVNTSGLDGVRMNYKESLVHERWYSKYSITI